ncbi:hypothetical protein [Pontibacter lucknowensis]|uniref:Uncharacterized protein n=1 Tax=Pontibacter lucknowensis TaxID=1077936 RepID=A0A1N6XJY9_9BACT|nr:hypothetical protein [Pontibacter lucknowensis]SIR02688.1 hypothetical protein SAMN05421545_2187 [Pontibacter lucknowensis]
MKNTLLSLLALLLISASSCQQSDNVQQMLRDEEDRRQVYDAILEDEQMRSEMMAYMRDRNMGAGMMRGDMMQGGMIGDTSGMVSLHRQQMQQHMKQMMTLCEADTAACNEMSRLMLQHQGMMSSMMQRMQKQGIVDSSHVNRMRQRMNR